MADLLSAAEQEYSTGNLTACARSISRLKVGGKCTQDLKLIAFLLLVQIALIHQADGRQKLALTRGVYELAARVAISRRDIREFDRCYAQLSAIYDGQDAAHGYWRSNACSFGKNNSA